MYVFFSLITFGFLLLLRFLVLNLSRNLSQLSFFHKIKVDCLPYLALCLWRRERCVCFLLSDNLWFPSFTEVFSFKAG